MPDILQSARDMLLAASVNAWLTANRIAGYAVLNLLDDPAILAMAFC